MFIRTISVDFAVKKLLMMRGFFEFFLPLW